VKIISLILAVVILSGCANRWVVGIGYHKTPVRQEERAEAALLKAGIPPAVIEAALALLGTENFRKMVEAALPPEEEVFFGGYMKNYGEYR
jgi:hypothetical protein